MSFLKINICDKEFKNPIMPASGTFASGQEFNKFYDIGILGAVVTKGVSITPWYGNESPRICECDSGMLNAIGLQNPGIDTFIDRDIKFLSDIDTNIIVNVCGHSIEEYKEAVIRLSDIDVISMLEINISCPNVKSGGIAFGQDPKLAYDVTKTLKAVSKKPLIMKLSPNVTDITEMVKAVEDGGCDCISLINTITGLRVDVDKRIPMLANITGGLSGPAIKPIALRMVYQARKATKLPIIGMGGISNYKDVLEFLMAGANAVAVGTANFTNPLSMPNIIKDLDNYLDNNGISDINEIIDILN